MIKTSENGECILHVHQGGAAEGLQHSHMSAHGVEGSQVH